MGILTLRFTGRLLGVDHQNGKLDMLAVDIPGHRVLMTVPTVNLVKRPPKYTLKDVCVIATRDRDSSLESAAYVAFDLRGWDVTTTAKEGFRWNDGPLQFENAVAKGIGVADVHLTTKSSKVSSKIHLNAGHGTAKASAGKEYAWVTAGGRKIDDTLRTLADVVDVDIPFDGDTLELRLTSRKNSKTRRTVSIDTEPTGGCAVIVISNLCLGPARNGPDLEFARFYDLIQGAPRRADRPVPEASEPGGMSFECFVLLFIAAGMAGAVG